MTLLQVTGRKLQSASLSQTVLWGAAGICSLGLLVAAYVTGDELQYRDEQDYLLIADNLVDGNGYEGQRGDRATRPPVWPLILAAFRLVGTSTAMLSALSAGLLIVAALLAKQIGHRLAGTWAAWLAFFGTLLYPVNVYTALTLYPQTLVTVLMLGCILLVLRTDAPTVRQSAAVGFLLIGIVYSVPTMVFTAVALAVWACWRYRRTFWRFAVVAALAGVLPVALWTARNVVVLDDIVPVSTTTGQNMLLGNSENATAATGSSTDIDQYREEAEVRGYGEVDKDDYFMAEAVDWVATHPRDAALLYIEKVGNYFAAYNTPVTASRGGGLEALVSWAAFLPVVVAAAARLFARRALPLRPGELLMYVLFLGNALFMALAFTRTRFRQPLDCLMIIEAAVLVAWLVSLLAARRKQSMV